MTEVHNPVTLALLCFGHEYKSALPNPLRFFINVDARLLGVPLVLVRLRQPRRVEKTEANRFLAETGTIHRLGRGDSSETA